MTEPTEPNDWTDEEIAEFAAKDFEPWDTSECPLPTNQEWIDSINPHLISLRLAWVAMGKTKAELVEQLEADGVFKPMLDGIGDTERQMRGLHDLSSAALARLMCAATVVALRKDPKVSA